MVPVTQTFLLCFHYLTKPTTFLPAVMTSENRKPLFAQNVFELTMVIQGLL